MGFVKAEDDRLLRYIHVVQEQSGNIGSKSRVSPLIWGFEGHGVKNLDWQAKNQIIIQQILVDRDTRYQKCSHCLLLRHKPVP